MNTGSTSPPPTYYSAEESAFQGDIPLIPSRLPSPVPDSPIHSPTPGPSPTQPHSFAQLYHSLDRSLHFQQESESGRPTSVLSAGSEITSFSRPRVQRSQSNLRSNTANHVTVSRKSKPQKRFLSLHRTSASIKGPFTIKPFLHIPAALLGRIPREERKNLKLDVENGGIDVDINLVDDPSYSEDSRKGPRTTLDLKISGGPHNTFPLIAKIHTTNGSRVPFHLTATGVDGYLSLHLPRSFFGLLTIKVDDGNLDSHITTSRDFSDNLSILSEASTTRSYFVGELGGWEPSEQGWAGDQLDVNVKGGKIRIQYVGEKDLDVLRRVCWQVVGL